MNEQEALINELREAAGDHAHGEGYLAGLLKRGAASIKALHAEAEALRLQNAMFVTAAYNINSDREALRAENGRLRNSLLAMSSLWPDSMRNNEQPGLIGFATRTIEIVEAARATLTATPAPEVRHEQAEQAQCDRDLELFGVSFSVRGRRVDPADVVWRMKHADVGAEVSRYDDFRGDNKWLVSSASSLLALDEKGALTGGGIGGHARTIIASLAARIMQQEDRQQPSQDVRGLVEALERISEMDESSVVGSIPPIRQTRAIAMSALAAHRRAQRKG